MQSSWAESDSKCCSILHPPTLPVWQHSKRLVSGLLRHLPRCLIHWRRPLISASTSSESRSLHSPTPQCRGRSMVQLDFANTFIPAMPPNVTGPGGSRVGLLDTKTWNSNFNVALLATATRLCLNYNPCLIISDLLHNPTAFRVVL